MQFDSNSAFLYGVALFVVLFVIAQSIFFLLKAVKQANKMNMGKSVVKKTIISSAVFTIAPAVSILLGVISLSKFLGLPLPWIRLSVIGSLTYELTAAASAASSLGVGLSDPITDPRVYTTIAWIMTLGIILGIILIPIFLKKIQKGIIKMKNKDSKWGELFIASMFLGMISAFLGVVFADIRKGIAGWIPVFVLLSSAVIMAVCGILVKKFKLRWLEDYALSFSLLGAMGFSIFITRLLV